MATKALYAPPRRDPVVRTIQEVIDEIREALADNDDVYQYVRRTPHGDLDLTNTNDSRTPLQLAMTRRRVLALARRYLNNDLVK